MEICTRGTNTISTQHFLLVTYLCLGPSSRALPRTMHGYPPSLSEFKFISALLQDDHSKTSTVYMLVPLFAPAQFEAYDIIFRPGDHPLPILLRLIKARTIASFWCQRLGLKLGLTGNLRVNARERIWIAAGPARLFSYLARFFMEN